MHIIMAGVDFNTAPLEERERFSFTSQQARQAMLDIAGLPGVLGCILLVTCNRTEIWISAGYNADFYLPKLLCGIKQLPYSKYRDLIVQRQGDQAVRHLFETASGIHSQIKWEDRILSQVKHALDGAREAQTTDEWLERLFQTAVSTAKKVKTQVEVPGPADAINCMTHSIKDLFGDMQGLRCLVIGSGEMGLSAARTLYTLGAKVTVTVRSYRHGLSLVPEHCMAVAYDRRKEEITQSDVVIGATKSPHFTLEGQAVKQILNDGKQRLFIDIACPRDFDPAIAGIGNTKLLNIEDLTGEMNQTEAEVSAEQAAGRIIDAAHTDFTAWRLKRESMSLYLRAADAFTEKMIRSLAAEGQQLIPGDAFKLIKEISGQTLLSLLFTLHGSVGPQLQDGIQHYIARQSPGANKTGGNVNET